ncbi:hypothetical protein L195_g045641 [Trifolium pratense]|uniref:Uncharacterized protein n=1 Tax=Trifolium pratense TaxID=57577 RepID=A0A2K3MFF8_TRIPR|nr:hypothetical protein L195_g045641 [Trifolium pratense]
MRERGRERERGAEPRANLGQPFRSPPSPEARHKWGGDQADGGDWTEVCYRRKKEQRQEGRRKDRMQLASRYQRRSFSVTDFRSLRDDRSPFPDSSRCDHDHCRNPRYSHSRDCYRARRDSWMKQRRRSCSVSSNRYRNQTAAARG